MYLFSCLLFSLLMNPLKCDLVITDNQGTQKPGAPEVPQTVTTGSSTNERSEGNVSAVTPSGQEGGGDGENEGKVSNKTVPGIPHGKEDKKSEKSRFDAIVKKYCKSETIPDNLLENATKCFTWRQYMDPEILKTCEDRSYGEAETLNQRRKLHCGSRRQRKQLKHEFWLCFRSEIKKLKDAGREADAMEMLRKQRERRQKWKQMSRKEKKKVFAQKLTRILNCMEIALQIKTVNTNE